MLINMWNSIYDQVEVLTGMSKEEVNSRGRHKARVHARTLFTIFARVAGFNHSEIARELKRDHTSILYLWDKRKLPRYEHILGTVQEFLDRIKDSAVQKTTLKPSLPEPQLRFVSHTAKSRPYRLAYEKYNGKCAVCGFDEIVEIHHIIPRYLKGTNDLDNLILLCPNHHALADRGMINIKGKLELMHIQ